MQIHDGWLVNIFVMSGYNINIMCWIGVTNQICNNIYFVHCHLAKLARFTTGSTFSLASPVISPCVDAGTKPAESSFFMQALLTNHYIYGAKFPRGGSSEIPFHLVRQIEKAGGRVLVRAEVSKILTDSSGTVIGTRRPSHSDLGRSYVGQSQITSFSLFTATVSRLNSQ